MERVTPWAADIGLDGSSIVLEGAPSVNEIHTLVKQARDKIELERRNNVLVMKCMMHTPKVIPESGFKRLTM